MSTTNQNENPTGAYYDRTMSTEFETVITSKFGWLIQFVKDHECLDFQTGYGRETKSWFSIYRGTGRVLRIKLSRGKIKFDADKYYKALHQPWFTEETLNEESFKLYLENIEKNNQLDEYYVSTKGEEKEGYYQNLISRRYTIGLKPEDDFVIIDKELVIAFESKPYKKEWNRQIVQEQIEGIDKIRNIVPKMRLPKDIHPVYGEFDFLAVDKRGNFIIMELKQDDGQKTYLSPVQTNYYVMQFEKLIKEKGKQYLCNSLRKMYDQKVRMGLINNGWKFPEKMACEVKACVVVGNKKGISIGTCEKYNKIKNVFLPRMEAFMATNKNDGTLRKCDFLTYSK